MVVQQRERPGVAAGVKEEAVASGWVGADAVVDRGERGQCVEWLGQPPVASRRRGGIHEPNHARHRDARGARVGEAFAVVQLVGEGIGALEAARRIVGEAAVRGEGDIATVRAGGGGRSHGERGADAVRVHVVGEHAGAGDGDLHVAQGGIGIRKGQRRGVDGTGDERGVRIEHVIEGHAGDGVAREVGDDDGVGQRSALGRDERGGHRCSESLGARRWSDH